MSLQEDNGDDPGQGIVLSTPRLTLRPPRLADAPRLARLADNPRIAVETARMPYPYREADAVAWISELHDADAPRVERAFLVLEGGGDGDIVGVASAMPCEGQDFEVGYWVGEPYWGRGIATEAAQTVIDHVFRETGLPRLLGHCRAGNSASRRVLEKCGFQFLSTGMIQSRVLNGPVPAEEFILERPIWQSLKHWGRR